MRCRLLRDDLLSKTGSPQEVLPLYYWPCPGVPSDTPPPRTLGAGGPKGDISPFFYLPLMPVTSTFLGIRASGGSSLSVSRQIKAFRGQCYHWGYKTVSSSWNLPSDRDGGLFHGLSCLLQKVGEQDCFLGRWVSISCKSLSDLQILLAPLWGGLLRYIPFPLRITPTAERCHWWEQDTSASGSAKEGLWITHSTGCYSTFSCMLLPYTRDKRYDRTT